MCILFILYRVSDFVLDRKRFVKLNMAPCRSASRAFDIFEVHWKTKPLKFLTTLPFNPAPPQSLPTYELPSLLQ